MKRALFLVVALAASAVPALDASAVARLPSCPRHWVGAWAASPSDASTTQPLVHQTVRMIVAPHLAGGRLRLRLGNRFNSSPVTLDAVHVGLRTSGASVAAGSDRAVTFAGLRTVTIGPGGEVVSDRVNLTFRAFQELAISVYVAGSVQTPTEHFDTQQTNYLTPAGAGDHGADLAGGVFALTTTTAFTNGWYFIDGVDVMAPASTGAVVTFGDSITDGFQGKLTPATQDFSDVDANRRYPDDLARRLGAAGIPLSVLNAGISGNRLLTNHEFPPFGPSGLSRFNADALAQAGVTDVVLLEGINDIGQGASVSPDQIIAGYPKVIQAAHAAGLKLQLGTLTPAGGTLLSNYGDSAANQRRLKVNDWIRTQHLSDGVIDFDAAVRDPQNPSRIRPDYDGSDHLHFNAAGYRAMANAIDIRALARPAPC